MYSATIDAHVHVWTADVARYPLASGFHTRQMQPPSFTAEEFMAIARPQGVERTVLIQMDFYGYDNSYLLDTLRQFPGVFSAVAQVDADGSDPAAEMRKLATRGVRGVRIAPLRRGDATWLASAGMEALWRCGGSEGIAICPLIEPEDLPALARMCRRFPGTTVVIDHCAGIGSDGTFRDEDVQSLCAMADLPRTFVKLSAFYFLGCKLPPYTDVAPLIRRLLGAFGRERLMWGSDAPFQVAAPHTYRASLELLRERLDFLSTEDKAWLLHGTAAKVFFN